MILETSPSPDFWMIDFNSSWVILPNPLGIHNAGYSYSAYDDDDDGCAVIDNVWFGVIVIYLLNIINFLHFTFFLILSSIIGVLHEKGCNKQYKHYLLTIYSSVKRSCVCARYDLSIQT